MAKSSSAKKVARAARSGGGRRARQATDRSTLFVIAMVAVVVVGLLLVAWARTERDQSNDPVVDADESLRAAYGVLVCDSFEANLPFDNDVDTAAGVLTFGDGLMYLPPEQSGQATLGDFFDEAGLDFSDESLELPGRTLVVEETECPDGETGELRVAVWSGLDPDAVPEIFSEDLRGIVLVEGQLTTVAFVTPGTPDEAITRPPSDGALAASAGVDDPTPEPASGPTTSAAPTATEG